MRSHPVFRKLIWKGEIRYSSDNIICINHNWTALTSVGPQLDSAQEQLSINHREISPNYGNCLHWSFFPSLQHNSNKSKKLWDIFRILQQLSQSVIQISSSWYAATTCRNCTQLGSKRVLFLMQRRRRRPSVVLAGGSALHVLLIIDCQVIADLLLSSVVVVIVYAVNGPLSGQSQSISANCRINISADCAQGTNLTWLLGTVE